MNNIEICRMSHSITKGKEANESLYPDINKELKKLNISLETNFPEFNEDEIRETCDELRTSILSAGDMPNYWKEAEKIDYRKEIIEHDAIMVRNTDTYYKKEGTDELGPRVLLLTTDGKVIRCQKKYPFIISTSQFVEFMLPYLFLSEISEEESNRMPNQLLSAQLGVNISFWEPSNKDVVSMFLNNPDLLKQDHWFGPGTQGVAKILNDERFKKAVDRTTELGVEERNKLAEILSPQVSEAIDSKTEITLARKEVFDLKQKLKQTFKEREANRTEKERLLSALTKYKRRVKYLKRFKRIR